MGNLTSVTTAEALKNLPEKPDLSHIPGETGWPVVGTTFRVLADPKGYTERMYSRYGPVYRSYTLGHHQVTLLGPEANELLFVDKEKLFSSELGWGPTLERLFPRGMMMLDFEVHRAHRKLMQVAFKERAMRGYVGPLNAGIHTGLAALPRGRAFAFYPAIKQLTLELAAPCFLGMPWGPEARVINQAFVDLVAASIAPIRWPLPGTAMGRGVQARKRLSDFFAREIPRRRGSGGQDMLTLLCNTAQEEGSDFSEQEVIDHMIFLMMAAHDTLTSSLTSTLYWLGRSPRWQEQVREECEGLGLEGHELPYEKLGELPLLECAFKEALRLMAPVPAMPRRALKDFEFKGYRIPAGTRVALSPLFTHYMPELWPEPEVYEPSRFLPENAKGRHRYAWVPFGGGAHMCIGLHFAYMQAKVFFYQLLRTRRIVVPEDYRADFQWWPIPKPKDGLPVVLEPLERGG